MDFALIKNFSGWLIKSSKSFLLIFEEINSSNMIVFILSFKPFFTLTFILFLRLKLYHNNKKPLPKIGKGFFELDDFYQASLG